jgi:hypothetical protein
MTLQEIITAVQAGHRVYWSNGAYEVKAIGDNTNPNNYSIVCSVNGSVIGLTWTDGQTLNGNEGDFYLVEPPKSNPDMVKAYFSLDDRFLPVMGYHDPSQNWNGWACPVFPMESVELILMYLGLPDLDADGLYYEIVGNEIFCRSMTTGEEDYCEVLEPVIVDGISCYDIGAFNWVWQEEKRVMESNTLLEWYPPVLPDVLAAYHRQTRIAQAEGRGWEVVNVIWSDDQQNDGRGETVYHVNIEESEDSEEGGIYEFIQYHDHAIFLADMRFLNQWEAIVAEA